MSAHLTTLHRPYMYMCVLCKRTDLYLCFSPFRSSHSHVALHPLGWCRVEEDGSVCIVVAGLCMLTNFSSGARVYMCTWVFVCVYMCVCMCVILSSSQQ